MLEIEAYAADCRVYGHLEAGDRRLTDLLNTTPELELSDARLESLDDGHVVDVPTLAIGHEELCAVVAAGPRGEEARRIRTVTAQVEIEVGPYHVEGAVHGTAAADPLGAALRRTAWVPLTGAAVTYVRAGEAVQDAVETLLVNVELARSFRAKEEVTPRLPWEIATTPPKRASRAVDLTDI